MTLLPLFAPSIFTNTLKDDVIRLDAHRRKYRSRFNNNVRKLSEKLSVYDDRLSSLHAQYDTIAEKVETVTKIDMVDTECQLEEMSEQIENLAYVDVPDLQSQVDEIEREISDVKMKQIVDGDFETARNEERKRIVDEAEKEMSALKELVERMSLPTCLIFF
jgi:prefoldin subunit 5